MKLVHKLIGLTGTNSSGKGEAASFFMACGYSYFSLSDIIRNELSQDQKEITRDNLIQKGNQLREEQGADTLARRGMEKVKGKAVIDSIRNLAEIAYLREKEGFILLAIDAPIEIRYARAKQRGRNESASTLEEFIATEDKEMRQNEKGQQLEACMQAADYRVTNEGSLENFFKKLEKFL
jgi:dephospho-CoA kinase